MNNTGTVGVLNVGAGDTKLVFDKNNPQDCIRAGRIVKDMLRRGYALLVATGKDDKGELTYERATDFDERTGEYIIADFDPITAAEVDAQEEEQETDDQAAEAPAGSATAQASPPRRKGRPPKQRRIDAGSTRAVAVSRSAGG